MLDAAAWTARLPELAEPTSVTGATLGIWADGQEVLAAYGLLSAATQVPVTTDSLFQVGSITKVWTATMIMQLIDEGRLFLDATVADVLPGVRLGAKDVGRQVTVAHLLTHTSGIDGDIFTDTGRGADCVERYAGELAQAARIDDREAFSDDEPQEFDLYPADATGDHFVGRLYDSSPWAPVVFGRLG